jgi:hypothetical protein
MDGSGRPFLPADLSSGLLASFSGSLASFLATTTGFAGAGRGSTFTCSGFGAGSAATMGSVLGVIFGRAGAARSAAMMPSIELDFAVGVSGE